MFAISAFNRSMFSQNDGDMMTSLVTVEDDVTSTGSSYMWSLGVLQATWGWQVGVRGELWELFEVLLLRSRLSLPELPRDFATSGLGAGGGFDVTGVETSEEKLKRFSTTVAGDMLASCRFRANSSDMTSSAPSNSKTCSRLTSREHCKSG